MGLLGRASWTWDSCLQKFPRETLAQQLCQKFWCGAGGSGVGGEVKDSPKRTVYWELESRLLPVLIMKGGERNGDNLFFVKQRENLSLLFLVK